MAVRHFFARRASGVYRRNFSVDIPGGPERHPSWTMVQTVILGGINLTSYLNICSACMNGLKQKGLLQNQCHLVRRVAYPMSQKEAWRENRYAINRMWQAALIFREVFVSVPFRREICRRTRRSPRSKSMFS